MFIATRYARPSYMPKYWPVPSDCILYLEGQQDAYSSTIRDLSGSGYNGTITNATWTTLPSGIMSLTFDGTAYVENTTADWRSSDSSGAILTWIKTPTKLRSIFTSADVDSATRYFDFSVGGANGELRCNQRNNDSATAVIWSTTVTDDVWHLVALVSSGTAYSAYIDGVVDTVASGTNDGDWFADTGARDNFVVGGVHYNGSYAQLFAGQIWGTRVYSSPLTADQIVQIYRDERHLFGV